MFLSPSHVAHDNNVKLLLQENTGRCIICKDACYTRYMPYMIGCNKHTHHTQSESFVICKNCVNVSINKKIELVKNIFQCVDHWYITFTKMHSKYNCIQDEESAINIIDKIVDNYFNLVERCYKFKNKSALLLLMSHNDKCSVLNFLPDDVIIFMLKFIYYDKM